MVNSQKPTPSTRHMDIKYFVLCKWIEHSLIKFKRVHMAQNLVDHLQSNLVPSPLPLTGTKFLGT